MLCVFCRVRLYKGLVNASVQGLQLSVASIYFVESTWIGDQSGAVWEVLSHDVDFL